MHGYSQFQHVHRKECTNHAIRDFRAPNHDGLMLFSQPFQMQQQIEDLRQEMMEEFSSQWRFMQRMNRSINCITIKPIICSVAQVCTPLVSLAAQGCAGARIILIFYVLLFLRILTHTKIEFLFVPGPNHKGSKH